MSKYKSVSNEELKELNEFFNNILLVGGTNFRYKDFIVSINDKCLWVLEEYVGKSHTVTIPNFIQIIGKNSFRDTSIRKITIPEGVVCIEESAFRCCFKLKEVDLPNTLTTIEEEAFSCCNIEKLIIPDNVIRIAQWAFYQNYKMEYLSIPKGIYIESWAFMNCGNKVKNKNVHLKIRLKDTTIRSLYAHGAFENSPFKDVLDNQHSIKEIE